MKRQIKFRGKSLINGKWVSGDSIKHTENASENGTDVLTYIGSRVSNARKVGAMKWTPVDDETVGQFTGLLDCNGKEIYEGDILECPQVRTIPLEVYYNLSNGAFCLAEHTHTEGILKGTTPIGDMFMYHPDMFVIGNIHEQSKKLER